MVGVREKVFLIPFNITKIVSENYYHQPMPWPVAGHLSSDCWFVAALQRLVKGLYDSSVELVSWTLLARVLTPKGTVFSRVDLAWRRCNSFPPELITGLSTARPKSPCLLTLYSRQREFVGNSCYQTGLFVPNQREATVLPEMSVMQN